MHANGNPPERQRRPKAKPGRSARICLKPTAERPGVVEIRVGKDAEQYVVEEIRADFGRAFSLKKVGVQSPPAHHVNIDKSERTCDCPGFERHSHCKHTDALAALVAAGRL